MLFFFRASRGGIILEECSEEEHKEAGRMTRECDVGWIYVGI